MQLDMTEDESKLCFGAYSYLDTASCHIATCTGMPVKTYHHWCICRNMLDDTVASPTSS